MPPILSICTSTDNRFAPHCGVMITSLLHNTSRDTVIDLHILDGGISEENKQRIRSLQSIREFDLHFHTMSDDDFAGIKVDSSWPVSANYRFKVASLLPGVDKLLYLDCDIIVLEDPTPLITEYPEGAWCCGVPDTLSLRNRTRLKLPGDAPYVNSGVLVIDLAAWRANRVEQQLFECVKAHTEQFRYQDQDVINVVLRDHIHLLPLKWNSQYVDPRHSPKNSALYGEAFHHPAIIHYVTSEKPWLTFSAAPRRKTYLHYLNLSPWSGELRSIWKRERLTPAPYLRRWRRLLKNALHFHTGKRPRLVRIFGITFLQDEPEL